MSHDLSTAFLLGVTLLSAGLNIYLSTKLSHMAELAERYREMWQQAIEDRTPLGLVEQNRIAQWEQRRNQRTTH